MSHGGLGRHQLWPSCLLIAALLVTAFVYTPGLGGSLHFDDRVNLDGLTRVVDESSVIDFVTQGVAGPTGRPLALASFVPQAYAWPDSPSVFLRTNVCLHLLNGALVAWLLYLLSVLRGCRGREAAWIASLGGAVWMLLPILASSSLLIVQRMTILSATFVLLGFVGYLYSRKLLERRPRYALLGMSTCVVLGTGLATLAKENGALLPLFVLVAETTLLAPPTHSSVRVRHRVWCSIFLGIPALALLGYLTMRFQYDESVLLQRGFSAPDRLLTEAHILWEYLYHAFLPATSNLGPFHDHHPVYRDWMQPLSMLAVGGWVVVIAGALALRRRAPLLLFAVGWYLVGHALESTSIPLELYFEHRNYVPLIGPVFALVWTANAVSKWQPWARAGLISYISVLAVVLFNTTTLWGRPALAAEVWAIHNSESRRATQYLVQKLEREGDHRTARRVLESYLEENPRSAGVAVQILTLSCVLEPRKPHDELIRSLESRLKDARFEHGVFETLRDLYRMSEDGRCDAVTQEGVYNLTAIVAANPAFQSAPAVHHNLHVLMAEEAFAQRNLDLTMHHIEEALAARYTMSTLTLAVQILNSADLYAEAEEFLRAARTHEPSHPMRGMIWRRRLASLEDVLHSSVER